MFALTVVLLCLMSSVIGRLIARRLVREAGSQPSPGTPRPPGTRRRWDATRAQVQCFPDRVQDRWTALDDRQVARLLDDSAPR